LEGARLKTYIISINCGWLAVSWFLQNNYNYKVFYISP